MAIALDRLSSRSVAAMMAIAVTTSMNAEIPLKSTHESDVSPPIQMMELEQAMYDAIAAIVLDAFTGSSVSHSSIPHIIALETFVNMLE